MKKIICACLFLWVITAYSCAHAQQNEKLTISTYYPAPDAVYKTVRLKGQTAPPADAKPGQLYYNLTEDQILYSNKSAVWTKMIGSGSDDGVWHLAPNASYPGVTPVPGDIFYNNTTNCVVYRNKTGSWVNMTIGGHWRESDYKPDSPGHYDVYLANLTATPIRWLAVAWPATNRFFDAFRILASSGPTEEEKIAVFSKYFTDHGTSQELDISGFAEGAYKTYLNTCSLVSVPEGHLKFAVGDKKWRISLHSAGYYSPGSEIINIMNLRNETLPALPRVCIGNTTTQFQLSVDSHCEDLSYWSSPFGVRGVQNGNKTGIFNVINFNRTVDLAYGAVFNNSGFYNDPYRLTNGTQNHYYARLSLYANGSAYWYCGDAVSGNTQITENAAGWNRAFKTQLWTSNGLMTCPSSRAVKENFVPVDLDQMLDKIDQLEVTRWNFKFDDKHKTYIGPVAEDFYRLFKTGEIESQLTAIDPIGVSLAGVKALIGKMDAQKKEIEELKGRLAAIRSRLSLSR